MQKFIQRLLGISVILFFCFGIGLQTDFARNFVKSQLTAILEKQSGYRVEMGVILLSPTLEISIDQVSLFDDDSLVTEVKGVRAAIFPRSLDGNEISLYGISTQSIDYGGQNLRLTNGSGSLNLKNRSGVIHLQTAEEARFSLNFSQGADDLFHISHLHLSFKEAAIDGQLTLDSKGNILDSALFLTTEDLSKRFSVGGYFYGEGKVLGSLWAPEISFGLFSDELRIGATTLRNVEAQLTSRRAKKGLTGLLTLSLVKDSTPYTFTGKLFWDEALNPLPTHLKSEIPLDMLKELFDVETTPFSGKLSVLFARKERGISTTVRLKEGNIQNYELGHTITQIEANLEGDATALTLTEIKARDERRGRYTGNGRLSLNREERFPFEMNISLDNVHFLQLEHLETTVSGHLLIEGCLDAAKISGNLTANHASFQIPDMQNHAREGMAVIYINQPLNEPLPTPFEARPKEIPLTFALHVVIPNNGKIHGDSLASTWGGTLEIAGMPNALEVRGELEAVKGTYKLRGRQLYIQKGTIFFNGDLDHEVSLYVIGTLKADRYAVDVIVKGSIEDPQISFRSNPPLSRKEILSWLLFNKDLKEISEFQGNRLDRSILSLSAATQDGPDILSRLGDAIGIDRVDIAGNPEDSNLSFELGKYVSDNTYISISRKSTRIGETTRIRSGTYDDDHQDPSNRIGIETYLTRDFKIQAEIDEDQTGQINIIWKRDY